METVYWMLNYFEEFIKLYLFLFFVLKIKRRKGWVNLWTLLLGGVVAFLTRHVPSSYLWLTTVAVIGNMILTQKLTLFYVSILGEVVISFVDTIASSVFCEITGYTVLQLSADVGASAITDGISLCLLLMLSVIAYSKRKENDQFFAEKSTIKYLFLILTVLITSFIGFLPIQDLILLYPEDFLQKKLFISATVSSILFIVIIIITAINIYDKAKIRQEKELYQKLMQEQKDYYEDILSQDTEVKKFRHDVTAHFNYIKSFLDKGDIIRATDYVGKLAEKITALKRNFSTGNIAVDMILEQTSGQNGAVTLTWEGAFPSKIRMDDVDICVLLGNALRNAVSAASCQDGREKTIDISCRVLEKNVILVIKNPLGENANVKFKNGRPVTDKDQNYHGFGTVNMEDIAKKYGGSIQYNVNEGEFAVSITLNNIICSD